MRALKTIFAALMVCAGSAIAQTPGTLEQWKEIAQKEAGEPTICGGDIACQWPRQLH